jgi:RNA polymerase sigma-70 factor, ECF subfamily
MTGDSPRANIKSMSFPDEKTLVEAAQAGDLAAFNELVLKYQDQAYNVAYRLLNDAESAADAVQESFFKVYRRIEQYRGGSFRAWLLRIVTNTCYDTLRLRKRHYASRLDSETLPPDRDRRLSDLRSSPHDDVVRRELNSLLTRAIMQLPPGQRTVLVMCDVEGFEYHEVADMTGLALGTVKSRLSRARTKVRGVLVQKGFSPNVPSHRSQLAYSTPLQSSL